MAPRVDGLLSSVIIVRHCQSEHHLNGMTGGWTDTPLTDLGRQQASQVAERLKRELPNSRHLIYTSDLARASQTADIISQVLGLSQVKVPELREINNGIAAGMTQAEAGKFESPMPLSGSSIDWQHFPQGETWRLFHARIAAFMERLSTQAVSETPILVTHGGCVINIIAWWLHIDVEMLAKISFATSPGGITWLTTNSFKERTLTILNDTHHLED